MVSVEVRVTGPVPLAVHAEAQRCAGTIGYRKHRPFVLYNPRFWAVRGDVEAAIAAADASAPLAAWVGAEPDAFCGITA